MGTRIGRSLVLSLLVLCLVVGCRDDPGRKEARSRFAEAWELYKQADLAEGTLQERRTRYEAALKKLRALRAPPFNRTPEAAKAFVVIPVCEPRLAMLDGNWPEAQVQQRKAMDNLEKLKRLAHRGTNLEKFAQAFSDDVDKIEKELAHAKILEYIDTNPPALGMREKDKNWAEAKEKLAKARALQADPALDGKIRECDYHIDLAKADAAYAAKKYAEAEALYRKMLQAYPEHSAVIQARLVALQRAVRQRATESIRLWQQSLYLEYRDKGKAEMARGEHTSAVAYLAIAKGYAQSAEEIKEITGLLTQARKPAPPSQK